MVNFFRLSPKKLIYITFWIFKDRYLFSIGAAIAQSVESSTPNRRARIRGSPKLPRTLMAPGVCKIRRGCNVLQVPTQIIPLEVPKWGRNQSAKVG